MVRKAPRAQRPVVTPRERLTDALAALDALFVELTDRDATRRPGETYAGRSLVYLECTRDARFGLGGEVLAELRRTLPLIFMAGRWYCRQVYERGVARIRETAARNPGARPVELFRELAPRLLEGPDDLPGLLAELQGRWQRVVDAADDARAALAAELFDDEGPLWTLGVYHSADVQVAARDAAAAGRGEFLCVTADVHPGGNPLGQPVFSARLPTDAPLPQIVAEDTGGFPIFAPPIRPGGFSPRVVPFVALPDVVHIQTSPDVVIPPDRPIVTLPEIDRRGERFVTPDGAAEGPLEALFELPMFIGSVRNFSLAAAGEHTARTTVGRTVTHRESWEPHPRGVPADAPAFASWARDQGMPRRVFLLSSEEPKPMYVDLDSPVLTRLAARVVRRTAEADGSLRFSEMLPGPEDCWLTDDAGRRYTSELRLVAVDERLGASRV